MIEVEAKARLRDHEKTEKLLVSRGATFQGEVLHTDTYFLHPSRDYGATDETLRLRIIRWEGKEEHRLTYKGPRMDQLTKTREELEVEIGEPEDLALLLKKLRFTPLKVVKKKRRYYELDRLEITVDFLDELGWFIEVETEVEEDWENARDGVVAFMKSIGCGKLERRSYLELLMEQEAQSVGDLGPNGK